MIFPWKKGRRSTGCSARSPIWHLAASWSGTHAWPAALVLSLILTGCGVGGSGSSSAPAVGTPTAGAHVSNGRVFGGQQPVAGATVEFWQVGTTGYGTGAAPLGSSVITGSDGSFDLTGKYSCSNAANGANSLVYITATGGNPGLANGTNNSALFMMAALGPCGNLTPTTYIVINEVTTVGSIYALSHFMGTDGAIGSYGASNQGLVNAFATVNNLVNTATGNALAVTPNGNGIVPQAELDTLADIVAPCVNSTGPASPPCSNLFTAATPVGGVAPATVLGATLSIALNPANNVSALLALPTASAPFQPTVTSANDLSVAISFGSGGSSPKAVALDALDNVWVANYGTGGGGSSVSMMTPLGVPATNSPFSGATYVNGASAIAVDASNNVWLANGDNNSAMELRSNLSGSSYTISPVNGPFNAIGVSMPNAIAVDPSSNIWIANSGNNSVTSIPNAGCNSTSCATTYTGGGLNRPSAIALDTLGNAWVTNGLGGSVSRIQPTATPASFTGGGITHPAGVAIDGALNIWVTDATLGQVSELNGLGAAVSPGGGYTGGGVTGSSAVAIDGSGNIWAADTTGNRLSELSSSGAVLSPATGYRGGSLSSPDSLAIDNSGNVWVANGTPITSGALSLTVTEFVGLASPAVVPLAQAVKVAQLGQKPGAPATPRSPLASAGGPYGGLTGASVNFSGVASIDPKAETLAYAWNFGDGSIGSGPTPAHGYFSAGTYPVSLTVTNLDSLQSSTSSQAVIVAPAPPTPLANAGGPYSGTANSSVGFNGLGSSDPSNLAAGGLALAYTWNFGDGSQGAGPTPVHTYSAAGTYNVSMAVQTALGGTATTATTATIAAGTPDASTPTANAGGPYSGAVNKPVTFSGAGSSDPNSLPLIYIWNFGDGNVSSSANPTYTYTSPGNYSVVLTVSNGTTDAKTATTAVIAAAPVPSPLIANAGGPYTVNVNQPLVLSGTQTTNPAGRQLVYSWDFGDGTTGSGGTPSHIYKQSGTYTAGLNVTDGAAQNGNASAKVTVTGPAAESIAASAGGPYADLTSHLITFDATASSDNLGNPLTFHWDFGDGTTGTGVTPTHSYSAKGSYTATVTASTTASSATGTATAAVVVTNALQVSITSPTANALFGTNTLTVSGTVSAPNLTVSVNNIPAVISGTSFTATGVSLREGVNQITATATDGNGGVGTGTVSVILDVTAPAVSITSPVSGSTVTTPSVSVAGLVNDIVTGTVGSNNVTVTVNGLPAQVANRSYLLSNLQLVPGTNTITVVATDNIGNKGQTTETVQLLPAVQQLSLVALTGDGQTGVVQTVLPQPLVVQLVAANGTPVAGRPVTFTVSRGDGMVEVLPTIAQSIAVTTDSLGKASAIFQLGSRSGLGINQVSVTTPGAAGAALYTETSTTGPATQIHLVNGDNQRGTLGEPLAQAFQVIVQDAKGNPVPGVTVNYTSTGANDGTLDSPSPATDGNGKAIATLTLGQQEGVANYAVQAEIAGDLGSPVNFVASAYAPGPISKTSVSGVVLDNSNSPVQNATVTLQGTTLSTVTNANGNFQLSGAPVGTVTLTVDGSTALSAQTLPFLSFVLQDLPGQNNTLNKPIYLPSIDINDAQTVGGDNPVTLTMAGVPGVSFTVAPHSVTFPDGSTVGKLSLSQVKSDMVPMEPTSGTGPDLIWTLQPAGTRFSVPVQVTLPNTQGLAPGFVSEIYQYDHDLEQFVSAGTGHVSADGSVIVSDPGFGITKAGWGHGPVLPLPAACLVSCKSTECITETPGSCQCVQHINFGANCGVTANLAQCQDPGYCDQNGKCLNDFKPDGTPCDDGQFCTTPDKCTKGTCAGTPIPVITDPSNDNVSLIKFEKVFEKVADGVKQFTSKFKIPFEVVPKVNVEFAATLNCCESQKKLNVPINDNNYQGGLTVQTQPLPLPCCGVYVPGIGIEGIYGQLSGSILGQITHHMDQCLNQDCWKGGVVLEIQLQAGFGGSTGIIDVDANINGGIHGDFTVGCHAMITTLSSLDFKAEGKVIYAPTGASISLSYIMIPAQTIAQINVPFL